MTEVIWTPSALFELRRAFTHIAKDNPYAAVRVRDRIHNAAEKLVLFPNRGRRGIVEDTREIVVPRTSHIIVYRVIGDVVWVVDLIHGATNYGADEAIH